MIKKLVRIWDRITGTKAILDIRSGVNALESKQELLLGYLEHLYMQQLKCRIISERIYDTIKENKTEQTSASSVSSPVKVENIEVLYKRLEEKAPVAFRKWLELADNAIEAYEELPLGSCSVCGHKGADLFSLYVSLYARGRILDIGCGPQPVPLYLEGYPLDMIAGLDPIEAEHPFEFVHGLAEYLPWDDDSFETVICATSLDHVFLLEETLKEIHRVLCKGGRFIVWVSFVPESKKYNPYDEKIEPCDQYHLFHFSRSWFEEMLVDMFDIENSLLDVYRPTQDIFYVLKTKCPGTGK